ncbi:MAG: DUF4339 domain-containing protein [Pseudomonadota bacterium]
MAENKSTDAEWYLARDGQQFGPITAGEMRKLIELRHIRNTDLVWRVGLTEWQSAAFVVEELMPPPAPPQQQPEPVAPQRGEPATRGFDPQMHPGGPGPQQRQPHQPQAHQPHGPTAAFGDAPDRPARPADPGPHDVDSARRSRRYEVEDDFGEAEEPRRGSAAMVVLRTIAALLILGLIGGVGWLAYQHKDELLEIAGVTQSGSPPPVVRSGEDTVRTLSPTGTASAATNADDPAIALLDTTLWTTLSDAFPAWAEQQRSDAVKMQQSGTEGVEIEKVLTVRIAQLRRKHANSALAAAPETLRGIASAFLDNLRALTAKDAKACYDFIRGGERSPSVLQLLSDKALAAPLRRQSELVIKAIVDGSKDPTTHAPPLQKDYRMVSQELTKMGWTSEDMSLFGDPKKLAEAQPAQVCKLVTDWFRAQLLLSDQEAQTRLLVRSLRPVVAG